MAIWLRGHWTRGGGYLWEEVSPAVSPRDAAIAMLEAWKTVVGVGPGGALDPADNVYAIEWVEWGERTGRVKIGSAIRWQFRRDGIVYPTSFTPNNVPEDFAGQWQIERNFRDSLAVASVLDDAQDASKYYLWTRQDGSQTADTLGPVAAPWDQSMTFEVALVSSDGEDMGTRSYTSAPCPYPSASPVYEAIEPHPTIAGLADMVIPLPPANVRSNRGSDAESVMATRQTGELEGSPATTWAEAWYERSVQQGGEIQFASTSGLGRITVGVPPFSSEYCLAVRYSRAMPTAHGPVLTYLIRRVSETVFTVTPNGCPPPRLRPEPNDPTTRRVFIVSLRVLVAALGLYGRVGGTVAALLANAPRLIGAAGVARKSADVAVGIASRGGAWREIELAARARRAAAAAADAGKKTAAAAQPGATEAEKAAAAAAWADVRKRYAQPLEREINEQVVYLRGR